MPNIEIKARTTDLSKGREIAIRHKTKYIGLLHQIDTYFNTTNGRLKLREIPGEGAWLIPYSKTYEKGPAKSDYQLLEVKNPEAVKNLFSTLHGIRFIVDKTREVFLIDNVRVHLDQVTGLGNFIEFEAVFHDDTAQIRERESQKVAELMQTFGIVETDLVTSGYVDLLEEMSTTRSWTRGAYRVSTDPIELDLDLTHSELAASYWAHGIPRELFERSVKNSFCFGAFENSSGRQVGFARVISDFSTFAYLGDVFVVPEHRGMGVSRLIMECIMTHPRLQGLRRFCLGTRDAHGLYEKFGFQIIKKPENWMEIKAAGAYQANR